MKFDLKGLSRKELEKLRADIDKALGRLAEAEKKAALAAAEKVAQAHGYSLKELTSGAPVKKPVVKTAAAKKDGRAKVAPKFRNPANEKETWTGRGRKPKWVEAHLASGGALEDITI